MSFFTGCTFDAGTGVPGKILPGVPCTQTFDSTADMSDKFFVEPSPCIEYEGGLSMMCPAGNNLADHAAMWMDSWSQQPYTLHQALPQVVCQVCDVLLGADTDMDPGFVTFDLTWGPNMVHGEINQNDVLGYEVYFVDADRVIVDSTPAGSVAKPSGQSENVISSCGCDATKYSFSFVNVPVPTGAEALMVVPKDNNGYTMPVGQVKSFDDISTTSTTTGTSDTLTTETTTKSSITTTASTTTPVYDTLVEAQYKADEILPAGTTEDVLMASETYKNAKKTGLAKALNVTESRVEIIGFVLTQTRRLSSAAGRGLSATYTVTTSFTVEVSDADVAQDLTATIEQAAEDIKTQTNIAMAAADWSDETVLTSAPTVTAVADVVVTAVTNGYVTATSRTTTTGVLPPTVNSRAPGFAQLSVSVLALLIAAATASA